MTSTAFSLRGTDHADARLSFARLVLAVGDIEWSRIKNDDRLVSELRFQAVAVIFSSVWFALTVGNVAIKLFQYGLLRAVLLAAGAAYALYLIDQHYLIQRRGTPLGLAGGFNKVRYVTGVILMISASLMSTGVFEGDIERVLSEERDALRAQLAQSPAFKVEFDVASEAVVRLSQAAQRASALEIEIGQRELELTETSEEYRNQMEGNTTGARSRYEGRGRIARGLEAKEKRLAKQIETLQQQLGQVRDSAAQLPDARRSLAQIEARVSDETARRVGGPVKRLNVLLSLVFADFAACVIVVFWIVVGMLPDLLIWRAQGQSSNHVLFADARAFELEFHRAEAARQRRELRDRQAAALSPIEVSLGSDR